MASNTEPGVQKYKWLSFDKKCLLFIQTIRLQYNTLSCITKIIIIVEKGYSVSNHFVCVCVLANLCKTKFTNASIILKGIRCVCLHDYGI